MRWDDKQCNNVAYETTTYTGKALLEAFSRGKLEQNGLSGLRFAQAVHFECRIVGWRGVDFFALIRSHKDLLQGEWNASSES